MQRKEIWMDFDSETWEKQLDKLIVEGNDTDTNGAHCPGALEKDLLVGCYLAKFVLDSRRPVAQHHIVVHTSDSEWMFSAGSRECAAVDD